MRLPEYIEEDENYPSLGLPTNPEKNLQVKRKLTESFAKCVRDIEITRKKGLFIAPEANIGGVHFNKAYLIYQFELIQELLISGKVNTSALWDILVKKYGTPPRSTENFEMACRSINEILRS